MSNPELEEHLSKIATLWTLVRQAHTGPAEGVSEAQEQLLERYSGAVRRYLIGALRNADAADELFQEFCVRFLRGDFKNADPQRGRFRDYVKTALCHLVVDYHRRQQVRQKLCKPFDLAAELPAPLVTEPEPPWDADLYRESWGKMFRERAWLGLGEPHRTILRLRSENPQASSADLAEQLGCLLNKKLTVVNTRKMLHDARQSLADLLLEEVISSLEGPTTEELHQELIDLGLLGYCKAALERRGLQEVSAGKK